MIYKYGLGTLSSQDEFVDDDEKTSEVWVENVVQSEKNKCLSKLPSRLVAEVGRLH